MFNKIEDRLSKTTFTVSFEGNEVKLITDPLPTLEFATYDEYLDIFSAMESLTYNLADKTITYTEKQLDEDSTEFNVYKSTAIDEKFDLEKGIMMTMLKWHGYDFRDVREMMELAHRTDRDLTTEEKVNAIWGNVKDIVGIIGNGVSNVKHR